MLTLDKATWRRRLRQARRTIDPATRSAAHAAIAAHLMGLLDERPPGVLAAYAAGSGEASPARLAKRAASIGWRVVYPRVVRGTLVFHEASEASLVAGFRGIREPTEEHPVLPFSDIDILLVPGLGFDQAGHRLGQGGGFYDRLLAEVGSTTLTVGVAYAVQCVDTLPTEPHDRAVKALVTELGLSRLDGTRGA